MKRVNIVLITLLALGFFLISSLSGDAQQLQRKDDRRNRLGQITLSDALERAVPLIISGGGKYIRQGEVTETHGGYVKDHMWVVMGVTSKIKHTWMSLGFKGVITRMYVSTITRAPGMRTAYTLYKNGAATPLRCVMDDMRVCQFNYNVPIDIHDALTIAVHLPKTDSCLSKGSNFCKGATPIITLFLKTGSI